MTRFAIPPILRHRLYLYQPVDIYRCQPLAFRERSLTRIVPISLIPRSRDIQLDPMHLYVTSNKINSFRSNFCFGGHKEELYDGPWLEKDGCYKNIQRRIFFPAHGHRLVAHVLWKMMDKNPELIDIEDRCFENTETWNRWLKIPWTPMERRLLENNEFL